MFVWTGERSKTALDRGVARVLQTAVLALFLLFLAVCAVDDNLGQTDTQGSDAAELYINRAAVVPHGERLTPWHVPRGSSWVYSWFAPRWGLSHGMPYGTSRDEKYEPYDTQLSR